MSNGEFGFYCISSGEILTIFEQGSDLIRIVPCINPAVEFHMTWFAETKFVIPIKGGRGERAILRNKEGSKEGSWQWG